MAIESIANPKAAYQGSVPKVDTPAPAEGAKKMPEPLVVEAKAEDMSVKAKAHGRTHRRRTPGDRDRGNEESRGRDQPPHQTFGGCVWDP